MHGSEGRAAQRCAVLTRLSHSLWAGLRGVTAPPEPFLINTLIIPYDYHMYTFRPPCFGGMAGTKWLGYHARRGTYRQQAQRNAHPRAFDPARTSRKIRRGS